MHDWALGLSCQAPAALGPRPKFRFFSTSSAANYVLVSLSLGSFSWICGRGRGHGQPKACGLGVSGVISRERQRPAGAQPSRLHLSRLHISRPFAHQNNKNKNTQKNTKHTQPRFSRRAHLRRTPRKGRKNGNRGRVREKARSLELPTLRCPTTIRAPTLRAPPFTPLPPLGALSWAPDLAQSGTGLIRSGLNRITSFLA